MRTTKKIVSAVLAACMLASTAVVSSFAATADDSSAVSSDYARDNSYTKAAEDIDAQYAYSGNDLGVTYTKDATTFKVWSPTATGVKLNIFTKGSDDEQGASKVASYTLEKCSLTVSGTVFGRLHSLANGRIIITHTQSQQQTQHTSVQMQQRLMKHRMYTQRQQA